MTTKRLFHILGFLPFKYTFFVFAFVGAVIFVLFKKWYYQPNDESFYSKFLTILLKFGTVFLLVVIGFSLLSTIFCYLFFLLQKRNAKKGEMITVKLGEGKYSTAGRAPLSIAIFGVLRPFLGSIKSKLVYSDFSQSEMVVLDKNLHQEKKWLRSAVVGRKKIWLPDRREYQLKGITVFFEDFFGLFSFAFFEKSAKFIFTTPPMTENEDFGLEPNKTEEEVQRIKLPKKIQGELINYKSFEPGDDIRRIVWKVYARNKELVIRTPEIKDPYASHIYVYVSFLNTMQNKLSEVFDNEMLNHFKDKIRLVVDSLKATEFETRMVMDQKADGNYELEEHERDLYQMSVAKWKNDYSLNEFFGVNSNGALVLSSLIGTAEIMEALNNRKEEEVTLFLVKVSEVFKNSMPFTIERLLFNVKESKSNQIKRDWLLSGYRRKVLKNEKEIEKEFKQLNIEYHWI